MIKEIHQDCLGRLVVVIRPDVPESAASTLLSLLKEAQRDFPEIEAKNIHVSYLGGRYSDACIGLQFQLNGKEFVPFDYVKTFMN